MATKLEEENETDHLVYTEHLLSVADVGALFNSSIDDSDLMRSAGLTCKDAALLLDMDGENRLTPPRPDTLLNRIVRAVFYDRFMVVLLLSSALGLVAFALQPASKTHLFLSVAMLVIVVATTTLTIMQQSSSTNCMSAFAKMMASDCVVLRDLHMRTISATDLVVGDLVVLSTGDKVPADMRLLTVAALKVDNSSLTGENEPIRCAVDAASDDVLEARNVVFSGTLVVEGTGMGIVIRTGDRTKLGSIATLVSNTVVEKSTLQVELDVFVGFIIRLALTMSIPIFIISLCRTPVLTVDTFADALISSFIVIFISNVPQGLPSAVSGCLTMAAKRLAAVNVYVKSLAKIETLGAVTIIASDKTGTLTQNSMSVTSIWIDGAKRPLRRHPLAPITDSALHTPNFPVDDAFSALVHVSGVCNMANASDHDGHQIDLIGNATDVALYHFASKHGARTVEQIRDRHPIVAQLPFSSARKWMATITSAASDDVDQRRIICMKGASERVVQVCTRAIVNGALVSIDDKFLSSMEAASQSFMSRGRRVIGVAVARLDTPIDLPIEEERAMLMAMVEAGEMRELVFVGTVALEDPPKTSVPRAIERCKTAGIRVMMVTGDHPGTAAAIARQCSIFGSPEDDISVTMVAGTPDQIVVTGAELATFGDADWDRVLSTTEIVFARTSPHDKLEIVTQLQKRGEVVAVTGDGVNDAPALKKADVGVSMGKVGSDVAKDAADIILVDDEFMSLVAGIEQGRIVFDNLIKMLAYTLAHLLPQLVAVLIGVLCDMPSGMTSLMILTIDLLTEAIPSLSLAYEPGEVDVMTRAPRHIATDRLVSKPLLLYSYLIVGIINTTAAIVAYLAVFHHHAVALADIRNDAFFRSSTTADYATTDGRTLNPDEQLAISHSAQTAFFASVIIAQLFHAFMSKTRKASIFQHGWFGNGFLNVGIWWPVALMLAAIYIPALSSAIGTNSQDPAFLYIPGVLAGALTCVWNETRKLISRLHPRSAFNRYFLF